VFTYVECVSTILLLVLMIFAVSISGYLQTPLSLTCKIQTQCALLSRYESSHPISGLWLMAQLGLGLCETVHIYGETSFSTNTRPNTSCPSETYVTPTRGEKVEFLLM